MTGGVAFDGGFALFAVLAVALTAAVGIALRRNLLERTGGSVECGLRRDPEQNWLLGLAVYQPGELRWYSAFGASMRPGVVLARASLLIVSRRPAGPDEVARLGPDVVVIECASGDDDVVELALSRDALTGFLAWMEAAPPPMPGFA